MFIRYLIFILVITVTCMTLEGFQSCPDKYPPTTLRYPDIVELEVGQGIQPQVYWTHRYLLQQFPTIIQDTLLKLSINNKNNNVSNNLSISNAKWIRDIPPELVQAVDSILKYLHRAVQVDMTYNVETAMFGSGVGSDPSYGIRIHLVPSIPVSSSVRRTKFKTIAQIILDSQMRVVQAGVIGLPNYTNFDGQDPTITYYPEHAATDLVLSSEETQESLLRENVLDRKEYRSSKCFMEDEAQARLNGHNQTGCIVAGGVWDSHCLKDEDCPYYQSNRNYPNNFGGCNKNTGYCQFPKGMKPLSYTKAQGKPWCHNCDTGHYCCDQQEVPDYAFDDDIKLRVGHKELLQAKGLGIN